MSKDFSTLVPDVYAFLEGKLLGSPEVLEKFGPRLGGVLTERFRAKQEERLPTLRMSNLGTECLRKLWYELHDAPKEELSGQTLLKFTYGDLTESLLICLAEAAGHTVEGFQEEVCVDGVKGHLDVIIDGVLVDVKSCSRYTFEKFKQGTLFENDAFGYVAQLCGYAHAKQLPAAWLAFNKESGELCVLELPKERIDGYDISGRIARVRESLGREAPEERCYPDEPDGASGNRRLCINCSYCPFKRHCWSDSNDGRGLQVYLYSNGPRFLTEVKREPKVFKGR